KDFREGKEIIPILLMANLFLGVFYNLSIWYKLTNKTKFGAYIAIMGAVITLALNLILIPRIGYVGSAWATFLCYGFMMLISFILGQKYYPIQYNFKRLGTYLLLAVGFYLVGTYFSPENVVLKYVLNSLFIVVFLAIAYVIDLRKVFAKR
ncbi:MAG: polysaccharide biosynthesis C-terminal domain-containing protein, partial [Bacteroidales bacterium]|nr:polysaccharide biosynthesis C-terminal domain-containing protein [Bacteroidales bacterium]